MIQSLQNQNIAIAGSKFRNLTTGTEFTAIFVLGEKSKERPKPVSSTNLSN